MPDSISFWGNRLGSRALSHCRLPRTPQTPPVLALGARHSRIRPRRRGDPLRQRREAAANRGQTVARIGACAQHKGGKTGVELAVEARDLLPDVKILLTSG